VTSRRSRGDERSDVRAEPSALTGSSGFLLARLGTESRRRFAHLLELHGLTLHHFAVLLALAETDGLPQQKLSTLVGVDPRNAVPIIDDLEASRFIVREMDAADRRRYKVALTSQGRREMRALQSAGAKLEETMLDPLTSAEREQLQGLLTKLFRAL